MAAICLFLSLMAWSSDLSSFLIHLSRSSLEVNWLPRPCLAYRSVLSCVAWASLVEATVRPHHLANYLQMEPESLGLIDELCSKKIHILTGSTLVDGCSTAQFTVSGTFALARLASVQYGGGEFTLARYHFSTSFYEWPSQPQRIASDDVASSEASSQLFH